MSLVGVGGAVYSGNVAGKMHAKNSAADFFGLDAVTFPNPFAGPGIYVSPARGHFLGDAKYFLRFDL